MNRGFGYYFKKSSDIVSFVVGKQKFKDKLALLLYVVTSFFCKLFFLTRPLFLVADQNLANMIVNGHSYSILKAFEGAKERYFKIFFAELVEGGLYFGLAILIVVPCALTFLGAYSLPVAVVITIIGAFAWLITCFALSYNYKFVDYVATKNKDLDFSDYLYNSRISVRGLRGMLFGNDVVTFLLSDFLFLLCCGACALIGLFLPPALFSAIQDNLGTLIISELLLIVAIVGTVLLYFFVFFPIKVKGLVFTYLVAEDNCKTSRSIVVKRRPSNRVEYETLLEEPIKNDVLDINK